MEYTKGKWTTHGVHIIAAGQKLPVGLVLATWPNANANRNLQVAAPDMYEALKALLKSYEIPNDASYPDYPEYWVNVVKSLAKAEGK